MASTRYIVWLSGILLISFCIHSRFQSRDSTDTVLLTIPATRNLDLELAGVTVDSTRTVKRQTPVREDEFWLKDSDRAFLPFDIDFEEPDDSYGKIEKLWICNDVNAAGRSKKLIFVQPVWTAASVMNDALHSYAKSCHAGFASVAICSGLSLDSMISGTWANRKLPNSMNGIRCIVKNATARDGSAIANAKYVEAGFLSESIDMLTGQIPLGCHEKWKKDRETVVEARYIVALRSPESWVISSAIDKFRSQNSGIKINEVVAAIKQKVDEDLSIGRFHEIYARYLISPSQVSWIQKEHADLGAEHRVDLSLRNLKETNTLIAISEEMEESVEKLQYMIDSTGDNSEIFKAALDVSDGNDTLAVKEVLSELKKDSVFYSRFHWYLKYEKEIYDRAKDMHDRQLAWLRKSREDLR